MKTVYELSEELFNSVGSFESVRQLLEMNANPNLYHKEGKTALMQAARMKRKLVTEHLLEAGASITEEDNFGRNILYCAVEDYREYNEHLTSGDSPSLSFWFVDRFLSIEPKLVNATDHHGLTPLDFACRQRDKNGASAIFMHILKTAPANHPEFLRKYQYRIPPEAFNDFLERKYPFSPEDRYEFIRELISTDANKQPNTALSKFMHYARIGNQTLALIWERKGNQLVSSEGYRKYMNNFNAKQAEQEKTDGLFYAYSSSTPSSGMSHNQTTVNKQEHVISSKQKL